MFPPTAYPFPEPTIVQFKPSNQAEQRLSFAAHPVDQSRLVPLNFSELPAFTLVQNQYEHWGIAFDRAIALLPSNPAFVDAKQPIGLIPRCDRAPLAVQFHQPRQFVSASLLGTKPIRARAFNAAGDLVIEQYFGSVGYLHTGLTIAPMRHIMRLQADKIARVELVSDAPFVLRSFVSA